MSSAFARKITLNFTWEVFIVERSLGLVTYWWGKGVDRTFKFWTYWNVRNLFLCLGEPRTYLQNKSIL